MGNFRQLQGRLPTGIAPRQTFATQGPTLPPPNLGNIPGGILPPMQGGITPPGVQTLGGALPQLGNQPPAPNQPGLPQPGGAGFDPTSAAGFIPGAQPPVSSGLPLAPQPQFGLSGAEQSFQGGALAGQRRRRLRQRPDLRHRRRHRRRHPHSTRTLLRLS